MHGKHKMNCCDKCGKEIETRRLTNGLCSLCLKATEKRVPVVPVSDHLDAKALA
jgi:NMD protein affecting ribosome stability and mRNA decay